MSDPKPLVMLLLLEGIALLAVIGWWGQLPAGERLRRLAAIRTAEQVETSPPFGVIAQGQWLATHRLAFLQGIVGLGVVAGVIGAGEGYAKRRRSVLAGFHLKAWTIGIMTLPILFGTTLALLLLPWPLPFMTVACGLSGLVGVGSFCVALGVPYVP